MKPMYWGVTLMWQPRDGGARRIERYPNISAWDIRAAEDTALEALMMSHPDAEVLSCVVVEMTPNWLEVAKSELVTTIRSAPVFEGQEGVINPRNIEL